MAQLFPGWADTALRLALAGAAALALMLVIAPMVYVRTPYSQNREFPVEQPVQFDHRHHVEDDAIDCRYCHDLADKGPYAGVPPTERCMGCHSQVWRDSPLLEPVRRSFFAGQPLPWNRVHKVPDYVYFDHSVHVRHGVACASCHGRVDRMALDWQVAPLTMGWCLGCHRRLAKAPGVRSFTDCSVCHR